MLYVSCSAALSPTGLLRVRFGPPFFPSIGSGSGGVMAGCLRLVVDGKLRGCANVVFLRDVFPDAFPDACPEACPDARSLFAACPDAEQDDLHGVRDFPAV